MKKFAMMFSVAVVMLALVSCTTVNPAVSSQFVGNEQSHWHGAYTAVLNCSLFEADKAICAVAKRAHFFEQSRFNRQRLMNYEYKDMQDNKLSLRLQEIADGQIKVSIKIGKTGDVSASQEILVAIDEELQAMNNL